MWMDIVDDWRVRTAGVLFMEPMTILMIVLMSVLIMKPWSVLVFFMMPSRMPFICSLFIRDLDQISVRVWLIVVMGLLTIHDMSF